MFRKWAGSFLLGMLSATVAFGTARAQVTWADAAFAERSHDFGAVPRGAKVRHSFVLSNRTNWPITIVSLRVSCGCTSGQASASVVQPGGSAVVEAQMDTRNFVGRKATTLFVTLAAGNEQFEVPLGVASTILSDIVLNPGSLDFGTVARGQSPSLQLTIDRVGYPDWRVARMVSSSKTLNATLQETQRLGDSISYLLNVTIKPEAAAGFVRDEIRLISGDPDTPSIPVLVTAIIRSEVSASPTVLSLGNVSSTAGAQGRYVVRASRPFKIVSIEGTGDGFTATPDNDEPKNTHLVTLSYKPEDGKSRGDLKKVFRILTDVPDEAPISVQATLRVDR